MYYLITDIGSTTTKAYLCNEKGKVLAIAKVPTTVEKPYEDVTIGFMNAVKAIEEKSGRKIYANGKFKDDFNLFFTSSAGGGLQVTVVGITDIYSAKIGEKTAIGSGAVIKTIISGGDGRDGIAKIKTLKESYPDLILFAAGADSEFISLVCRMAQFIRKAEIKNKFKKSYTPIIYSGNKFAISEVRKILDNYPIFFEENICNKFKYSGNNLQKRVQDIFQTHVMRDAPGYWKIKDYTNNEVLPTPIAVTKAISLIGEEKDILLFDIGGATTDVYTVYKGRLFRSVSANIGMSYSILNTLKECGLENIMRFLTKNQKEEEVLNYLGHKYLNPTILPSDTMEEEIEASVAINAINKAIENHFELYKNEFEAIQEEQPFLKRLLGNNSIKFDYIIGSGGVISNNTSEFRKFIFSNINLKYDIAFFDKDFLFPHIGVSSIKNIEFAKKLLKESLHKIEFEGEISQKIYKMNLLKESSVFEEQPEVKIPTYNNKIIPKERIVNAGDILFLKEEKIYKQYYRSLPVSDDINVHYQTYKRVLKEKDLVLSLKEGNYYNKFFAPFDCELVEINKYQIVLSEPKDIDELKDYQILNLKYDPMIKRRVKKLLDKKYPNGLIGKVFCFNEMILIEGNQGNYFLSPMTGIVTDFDPDTLTISMKRLTKITKIETFASGEIKKIDEYFVYIKSKGTKIKCKFGFGSSQYAKIDENAVFIKNERDFKTFVNNDFTIAISYNLPYKYFIKLSKMPNKSLIIINDFDDFVESELFDKIIGKLEGIRSYCSTETRLKSGVIRPFIYYEN